ncbi:ubiquitin carboxyl-terminal hydrolase 47-like isoform X2 [Trachinotus anak]
MNHDRVELLRAKLDNFTISDYHGLKSPGLTCYLNSVLQVLFMTEDFREAIKRCCSKDSTTIDSLLGKLFSELERSWARTHSITRNLGIADVCRQRDAAEYFEKILCLSSVEASKIFKGELNHKTTCVKCKTKNVSRNFFWILPLTVENLGRQTYTVETGLKAFFKGETSCSVNKLYCDCCNKKQDADVGCEMTLNPQILSILLKRFSFDHNHRCHVKLHCKVDVPQTLHMEQCTYELYALVNHFGSHRGGHYTAEIKSFETGEWYHFNDDIVERVKQPLFGAGNTSVRSHTAYLLMYRKVSRCPEKTDEVNQEAPFIYSDVKAEGRRDEAEGGEALVPHHQVKDEHCSIGGNLMCLNADMV